MSASSPMKHIGWRFWWATPKYFTYPGLYVWAFKRNIRLVPLRSQENATRS